MEEKQFTEVDALAIQLDNLTHWAKVLNTETYLKLLNEAQKRNKKGYKSPYDVFRGCDIEVFIYQLMNNK